MKKTTIMFALMLGVACTASAQKTGKKKAQKSVKTEQVSNVSSDQEEKLTLTKEVYPQKEENSNLYHGLTKKLTFDRMIPPHGLEVTYDKTVHIALLSCKQKTVPGDTAQHSAGHWAFRRSMSQCCLPDPRPSARCMASLRCASRGLTATLFSVAPLA